ncbi:hypothetical protein HanPSC8_Chr04g0136301 [Helianthus annuus]|nr:hypothetical protein HanPSC8_Chr04g0136301 [Helianthus annuus]
MPSCLCLTENTHRHPTGFFPGGRVHFSHVLFFLSASISVSMAFFHSSDFKASCVVYGICSEHKATANALASLDKFPVVMFATGYLDLGATFYLLGGTPLFFSWRERVYSGCLCCTWFNMFNNWFHLFNN